MKPLFLKEGELHQADPSDKIDSIYIKGSTLSLFDPTLSYEKGDIVINSEYPWYNVTPVTDAGFTEGTGVAGTYYYYNPTSFLLVELTNDGSTAPHTIPPGWVVGAPPGHDPAKSFTGWGLWVAQSTMTPQVFNTANWLGPLRFDIFGGDLTAGSFTNGSVKTSALADNAVTLVKMQDIATGSLLGNNTGTTGDPAVLTATEVRTLLNVEDGANNYTLPAATDSVIGGIKPGTNLAVSGDGTLNVLVDELPVGSSSQKGIVQVDGVTLSATNGVIARINPYAHPNHSGDVVSNGDGATTIQPGVITSSMIVDGTIAGGDIAPGTITGTQLATGTITNEHISTSSGVGGWVPTVATNIFHHNGSGGGTANSGYSQPGPTLFHGGGTVFDIQMGGKYGVPMNVKHLHFRCGLNEAQLWYWNYITQGWQWVGNSGDNNSTICQFWMPVGQFPTHGTNAQWGEALGGYWGDDGRGIWARPGAWGNPVTNHSGGTYTSNAEGGIRMKAHFAPGDENWANILWLELRGYRT